MAFLFANNTMRDSTSPMVAGDWVGVCVHSLSVDDARLVNDSGARWIRVDVSPDFGAAVKNARAFNLSVLGVLDSWMFDKNWVFPLDDWRGNVTYYVSQYSDYVDAWEIWNEPANPNFTVPVDTYYSMVEIASPIIRQYDPTAKIVLFGGLNLWSGNDPHLDLDKNFSQQLAVKNITQFGDAVSVHAYPWSDTMESWVWQKYSDALSFYRGVFPSLEVWVTETGHYVDVAGELGQAQYLSDVFGFFSGENVSRLFWYSLLDNADENGFGLVYDGTPRFAYSELQGLLK